MITAQTLRGSSLKELERLYLDARPGPVPSRCFGGQVLHRLDTDFARSRAAVIWPFERLRFGVDFGACAWFFLHPRLRVGHFRVISGRSRWRDTETLQLHYDVSRLPFRGALYDEVKPLTETLCLGLGGLNSASPRAGDLFFFLLEAS